MKTIDIGGSGLCSSAIGIGCMRISELSVAQTQALIDTALELGINLFDHADLYAGGACEELFGKALADRPGLREKLILQSKCGIRPGYYDLSGQYILDSVDGILRRLQTDHLDLFLLHRPDALMEPEEIAQALHRLYCEGKVRYFGVSNMNPAQIELLQQATEHRLLVNQMQLSLACSGMVDSGLHANVPSPVDSRESSVLEYCRRQHITIQTWSPLQYGLFEGVFLGSEKYPALNAELDRLARCYGVEPAAIAIAWILRHPANMQVLTGSKSSHRIAQMAAAARIQLTREEWYALYRAAGNTLP